MSEIIIKKLTDEEIAEKEFFSGVLGPVKNQYFHGNIPIKNPAIYLKEKLM